MKIPLRGATVALVLSLHLAVETAAEFVPLEQLKTEAAARSKYLTTPSYRGETEVPDADLVGFRTEIAPILQGSCVVCHGPKKQKGKFRIDTLDPDLIHGNDVNWWIDVVGALTNKEMPPADEDVVLADEARARVIDWLSGQVLLASQLKSTEGNHSSFRRMTRYEFNYALQDLLGLAHGVGADLPPEPVSDEGFRNSSEMLQMTSQQFAVYREIARRALQDATIRGPQPKPVSFLITMDKAGSYYEDWVHQTIRDLNLEMEDGLDPGVNDQLHRDIIASFESARKRLAQSDRQRGGNRGRRGGRRRTASAYFLNRETGERFDRSFPYGWSLWAPSERESTVPERLPYVVVLPHGAGQQFDLGNYLPDRGMMRVRFRASRAGGEGDSFPSVRLSFGYRPSNNSSHQYILSDKDIAIAAPADEPAIYEWLIPLDGIDRNPFLRKSRLGVRPNPSEYLSISNVHQGESHEGATVHIDFIEVTAPFVTEWPPISHQRVFPAREQSGNEVLRAREVLARFMPKAWRRPVSDKEMEARVDLFQKIRPSYDDFQETMIEVLASVLASPNFLYLTQTAETASDYELAARLSFFLWSSQPDDELIEAASAGRLGLPGALAEQADRMLADRRSERFARQFTHQWLGMELLDHLEVDEEAYPNFSDELKRSLQQEPIAFFQSVLNENRSVMDFLHSDYAVVNQRLAQYYGVDRVFGNHFRKVSLGPESKRGGLLAQAGLLAMNSDGKDSHPLKRGIWVLENLLHDPPPPPPPAVPEIDLADPRILKMTMKERMEDHRNDPACFSCHAKIDPWGIAFENFDATGSWRDTIDGKPVDATSRLYNQSELVGMEGLKRYLLENRQDQFARAMVHKLVSYALGRALGFADLVEVERLTAKLRQEGDGLRTLIRLLVESELFRAN